jgi:hypothetical protein
MMPDRFKDAMRPSDFFRRNVFLSFQEDAIGIRLRDAIGVDNMMWGSRVYGFDLAQLGKGGKT